MVLGIGRAALEHSDVKPYVHDVLLSMALAEVRYGSERISILLLNVYVNNVSKLNM